MTEYLKKYPSQFHDVMAMEFAYGAEETEKILKDALSKGKVIELHTKEGIEDYLKYIFVSDKNNN